ncbi:MAG: FG-GAP-like repeat-containing protein [Planctomycetota bacterium]
MFDQLSRSRFLRHGVLALSLSFAMACSDYSDPEPKLPLLNWEEASALNNEGLALMDMGKTGAAREVFERLVKQAPDAVEGRVNLAIALLNTTEKLPRRIEADYARCRQILEECQPLRQDLPHIPYVLGVLLDYIGEDAALVHDCFKDAHDLRPKDPDVLYRLGQSKLKLETPQRQEALDLLQEAVAYEPHFASAWYGISKEFRRAKDAKNAKIAGDIFKLYSGSEPEVGKKLSLFYNFMGRYASAIRVLTPFGDAKVEKAARPALAALRFAPPTELVGAKAAPVFPWGRRAAAGTDLRKFLLEEVARGLAGGMAIHDLEGDGTVEIYQATGEGAGRLFRFKNGGVEDITDEVGLLRPKDSDFIAVSGVFGDVDHDGDPDLFVYGAGPDLLFMNDKGKFRLDTSLGGGDTLTLFAQIVDADHDGDLDILSAGFCPLPAVGTLAKNAMQFPGDFAGAPNHLFNNNRPTIYQDDSDGEGSFTDIAEQAGFGGDAKRSAALLVFDWDRDGDVDILEFNDGAPNRLLSNDRLWRYHANPFGLKIGGSGPALAALVQDFDQDRDLDLILMRGPNAAPLFVQNEHPESARQGALRAKTAIDLGRNHLFSTADVDLNGSPDLIHWDTELAQLQIHRDFRDGAFTASSALSLAPNLRCVLALDLDHNGSPDLLATTSGGGLLMALNQSEGLGHWLKLDLRGKSVNDTASMWSNYFGIGTQVEVAAGSKRVYHDSMSANGFMAGLPPRLQVGLGTETDADYIRTIWSDFVLQNERDFEADKTHQYVEVNRKASSCPVLFKWSGKGDEFEFVTDFLGVGGLGFLIDPNGYAPPDPTEVVRIGDLPAKDGKLMLRISEPMEEICYLDELALIAVAHPADVRVFADERLATAAPFPDGRSLAFRKDHAPRYARDAKGADTLRQISMRDRVYQSGLVRDARFVGYLAEENRLTFGFDAQAVLADRPHESSRLFMFIDGWVEYPYSHINFAGWQAKVRAESLSLDVHDGNKWKTALKEFGYPAGMSRTMALDITDLTLESLAKMRLRSNLEIYIDRIYLGWDVAAQETTTTQISFDRAELRFLGYPLEYSPDGRHPTLYDYQRVSPTFDWKTLAGNYTRFGDVRELIAKQDDRYVVMNHGDEIALEVDASRLPTLAKGWKRTFFLKADGWCKDMDAYTAFPATVKPLPFHAMKNYPPQPDTASPLTREWQSKFNTRQIQGTWPQKK